jgi:hypothetical protein
MKKIVLKPNQIVTLNDYPLHSNAVLKEYLTKCKSGEELPLVPVIRKDVVRKYFDATLLKEFEKFEEANPKAEYFMLDGSHRTTALTLAHCNIQTIVYEKAEDIAKARKLVAKGQIRESRTLKHTLEENCEILSRHFKRKPHFMTVEQKTKKMAKEKNVPRDMINSYN